MADAGIRIRFDIPAEDLRGIERAARRQLGPVVVGLTDEIIKAARKIARAELQNNREEERRNRATTRGKPHYIDSFRAGAPDLSGGRVRGVLFNDSPAKNFIEHGTKRHRIRARGKAKFPVSSMRQWGRDYETQREPYVEYGAAVPEKRYVNHPGSPAFKIVERAKAEVLSRHRKIQMRVKAQLSL